MSWTQDLAAARIRAVAPLHAPLQLPVTLTCHTAISPLVHYDDTDLSCRVGLPWLGLSLAKEGGSWTRGEMRISCGAMSVCRRPPSAHVNDHRIWSNRHAWSGTTET